MCVRRIFLFLSSAANSSRRLRLPGTTMRLRSYIYRKISLATRRLVFELCNRTTTTDAVERFSHNSINVRMKRCSNSFEEHLSSIEIELNIIQIRFNVHVMGNFSAIEMCSGVYWRCALCLLIIFTTPSTPSAISCKYQPE